jgi:6-pyruvoyltetrahydropterin/6-carboxytetrahydropterin synthase
MFELWKEFRFDSAHTLDGEDSGDARYTRMHGHSYQVEVWLRGERNSNGWVTDLGALERRIGMVAAELDHRYLNQVEGLGAPTMENIAAFVWMRLAEMPSLHKVVIRRDSANEGCVYRGPVQDAKSPTP